LGRSFHSCWSGGRIACACSMADCSIVLVAHVVTPHRGATQLSVAAGALGRSPPRHARQLHLAPAAERRYVSRRCHRSRTAVSRWPRPPRRTRASARCSF
jgi:hypothetical protein